MVSTSDANSTSYHAINHCMKMMHEGEQNSKKIDVIVIEEYAAIVQKSI